MSFEGSTLAHRIYQTDELLKSARLEELKKNERMYAAQINVSEQLTTTLMKVFSALKQLWNDDELEIYRDVEKMLKKMRPHQKKKISKEYRLQLRGKDDEAGLMIIHQLTACRVTLWKYIMLVDNGKIASLYGMHKVHDIETCLPHNYITAMGLDTLPPPSQRSTQGSTPSPYTPSSNRFS